MHYYQHANEENDTERSRNLFKLTQQKEVAKHWFRDLCDAKCAGNQPWEAVVSTIRLMIKGRLCVGVRISSPVLELWQGSKRMHF